MSQAWAFRAEEERLAKLRAEYNKTLAGITDEQCLAADNVLRLKTTYDQALERRDHRQRVEADIAEHPIREEIERLKARLAAAEGGLRAATVEAIETDPTAKKALALRKEVVELRAHIEVLSEGLELWARRQRAEAPQESDAELQIAAHKVGEKLDVALRNERIRLACLVNREFEQFVSGAEHRGRM